MRKEFAKAIQANQYEVGPEGLFLPKQKIWLGGVFETDVCRDGELLGVERSPNIVVNQGLNHILDVVFHNVTQVATWYIAIFKGNYTPVATDTAANIASNSTEATEYTETTRQEYIEAAAASQSITNTANKAKFTINATVTIYGAFLVSTNTKSGTTGTLAAASRFASQRDLVNLDELLVTYTLTAADA